MSDKSSEILDYIKTNKINFSVNLTKVSEFLNWYRDDTSTGKKRNLIIRPLYQRKYRWKIDKKTKLLETIVYGIPIPAIFLFHDQGKNEYEIIDGLQRIGTILEFFGELEDEFILLKKEKISIKGLIDGDYFKYTDVIRTEEPLKNRIRNYEFITVIFNNLDTKHKHLIFRNLNNNGEKLSVQELRNNEIINKSVKFYDSLEKIGDFLLDKKIFKLSSKNKIEYKDFDLILRFYLLNSPKVIIKGTSIQKLIDEEVKKIREDQEIDVQLIKEIFSYIQKVFGDYPFKAGKKDFSEPIYDFIMAFVFQNYSVIKKKSNSLVKGIILQHISSETFKNGIKLGNNAITKLKFSLDEGKKLKVK